MKDPPDPQSRTRKKAVPELLGMNIIQKIMKKQSSWRRLHGPAPFKLSLKPQHQWGDLQGLQGGKNISLPAGLITTVDATSYWGSLPGEEGGILAEPLRDKTHHGLIIASTLTSVCGKHVKLQVANDLLVCLKLHICNWIICSQYIIAQKAVFINSVIF